MPTSIISQLTKDLDFPKLIISALKAMFLALFAFSMWLVVFFQADRIAETFLDDYVWVLVAGFIVGCLYSLIVQK